MCKLSLNLLYQNFPLLHSNSGYQLIAEKEVNLCNGCKRNGKSKQNVIAWVHTFLVFTFSLQKNAPFKGTKTSYYFLIHSCNVTSKLMTLEGAKYSNPKTMFK